MENKLFIVTLMILNGEVSPHLVDLVHGQRNLVCCHLFSELDQVGVNVLNDHLSWLGRQDLVDRIAMKDKRAINMEFTFSRIDTFYMYMYIIWFLDIVSPFESFDSRMASFLV